MAGLRGGAGARRPGALPARRRARPLPPAAHVRTAAVLSLPSYIRSGPIHGEEPKCVISFRKDDCSNRLLNTTEIENVLCLCPYLFERCDEGDEPVDVAAVVLFTQHLFRAAAPPAPPRPRPRLLAALGRAARLLCCETAPPA